ncbi:Aldolase-type TIM barrel [Cynara cardunculus var. scolymus]|uniref:Aldolase-type TIM barrel n=1 Tax=Cynara cardunculus var. scolymus TaxID=59895 RepID=A0A124SGN5_CYNCS|nr:Aldolase-type TIM barrel [Cynara cardunculus var. scolymus]
MALLQFMCSVTPLARAVKSRSLIISFSRTVVTVASTTTTTTTKTKMSPPDSNVLLGMSEEQLQQLALDFGQQSYRGKQLHHLLYKRRVKEIQEFSQVPLAFRTELQEAGWVVGRSSVHSSVVAADGTIKLLIKLEDNRLVETVGIPVADDKGSVRLTACVSSQLSQYSLLLITQVGCPLRCSFCATGKGGFSRNLKGHEIVEQVLAIEEVFNNRVTNVVFMGMGEPMLNLKEVLAAHRCLNKDVQIGQRMMTISTVGVPNTIKKLASHKLQSTLALSLHAPNQKLREKIVPSAKAYPLEAIMKDCRDYFHETSRRVSFEYTLLAGVNDDVEHAKELAELLHQWGPGYHVNLIPFNPIDGTEYKRPYRKAINIFQSMLESRKITVSVRQTRGLDASAACGQLRNEFQKSPLVTPSIDDIQAEPEPEPEAAVAC